MSPLRLVRRRREHSDEYIRDVLSSYIYGNIIVLTAAIAVRPSAISHGTAIITILAAAVTTYLAHVFSHAVAHGIGHDDVKNHEHLRSTIASATPIATSAVIPCAIFALGWAGFVSGELAQLAADIVLIVRVGMVGFFIQRHSGHRPSFFGLWAGIILAAIALVIVGLKLAFGH